jgi:hypothetical protein
VSAVEVPAYTARRIERIVERALRECGALGTLPTPLGALREAAGIAALEPIAALPGAARAAAPGVPPAAAREPSPAGVRPRRAPPRAVLGALWFEGRTMYVDERQSAPRRRFTEAHELIHALCPWHHAALREDTAHELFGPVRDAVEAEANAGAGMLLFQGSAFAERAAAQPRAMATVRALAEMHGASLHATLHHYTRAHPAPVAMFLAGRFPLKGGGLPVWRGVESSAFARRHGPASALLPEVLAPGSALHELLEAARRSSDPPTAIVELTGGTRVRAEAHYNRHAFLVLLVPARVRTRDRAPARAAPPAAPARRFARA